MNFQAFLVCKMNINKFKSHTAESELVSYCFSEGNLNIELLVPDLFDSIVVLDIKTDRVMAKVPSDTSTPYRTCHVEFTSLESLATVNKDGIVVPPEDFKDFMRQTRKGMGLAYGLHLNDCSYIFRIVGSLLLSCVVKSEHDIRCEVTKQG